MEHPTNETEVIVYLPAEGTPTHIKAGSGIVGRHQDTSPEETERGTVWYEGNLYGAGNLQTYVERIQTATDRMTANYPTVAVASLPRQALVEVGTYNTQTGRVWINPEFEQRVAGWIGAPLSAEQLQSETLRHQLNRYGYGPEVTNWNQAIRDAMRRPGTPQAQKLLRMVQAQRNANG